MIMAQEFYRVANVDTGQGLWYSKGGDFTGLIHSAFNFCRNNELTMPFDPEIVGWLSATKTLGELLLWFPEQDILKLEDHRWYIHIYEASRYKKHQNHWVICQKTSKVNRLLSLKSKLVEAE